MISCVNWETSRGKLPTILLFSLQVFMAKISQHFPFLKWQHSNLFFLGCQITIYYRLTVAVDSKILLRAFPVSLWCDFFWHCRGLIHWSSFLCCLKVHIWKRAFNCFCFYVSRGSGIILCTKIVDMSLFSKKYDDHLKFFKSKWKNLNKWNISLKYLTRSLLQIIKNLKSTHLYHLNGHDAWEH